MNDISACSLAAAEDVYETSQAEEVLVPYMDKPELKMVNIYWG